MDDIFPVWSFMLFQPEHAPQPHCLNRILLRWCEVNCDFIRSQVLKDTLYFRRTPMVNIDLSIPVMTGDDIFASRFNMYYRQLARAGFNYARARLYPQAVRQYYYAASQGFPFNGFELVQTFEATYCKKPVISLYYDRYEFTGGAHGTTTRTGNTWNTERGVMLSLRDLFKPGYDYKDTILRVVERDARHRQATGQVQYLDNLSENIGKYYDDRNYYLSENGIVIFYPLYTIAPYAAGIQTFTVPWIVFGDNLVISQ